MKFGEARVELEDIEVVLWCELIESKKALAESVVGAGEGWLTELSTDELREIMALRAE